MMIEAKVQNVEGVIVKMTIEMTIGEWMLARDGLQIRTHSELRDKIFATYESLRKVVTGEATSLK